MALVLNPLPDAELVLGRAEQLRLLFGVLAALMNTKDRLARRLVSPPDLGLPNGCSTHIVQNEEDFALSGGGGR